MFKHVTASKTRVCEFLSTANRLFRYNVSRTFTIEIFMIIQNWSNHCSHVDCRVSVIRNPKCWKYLTENSFQKMTSGTFSIVWRINNAILNGLELCLCAYSFFYKGRTPRARRLYLLNAFTGFLCIIFSVLSFIHVEEV